MTKTKLTALLATTAVLALAACGSSTNSAVETTRLLAKDVGTASAAFADGKTLVSQDGNIVAVVSTLGTDESKISEDTSLSIRSDGAGGIILEINGNDYQLSADDRAINDDGRSFGFFVDDTDNNIFVNIFSQNGEILPFIEGTDNWFVRLFQYQLIQEVDSENDIWTAERGFTVVGTETSSSAMGRFRSQTRYDGWSAGDVVLVDQDRVWANRTEIRSNVAIEVDFSKNTLEGELFNIELRQRVDNEFGDRFSVDGKILLQDGVISGSGFSGTTQTDATFEDATEINTASGTFQGNFFGSDAQQLGATYNLSNEEFNAVGGFIGRARTD